MYLLDTKVLSELREPKPQGGVVAWLADVAEEVLYLSEVTLGVTLGEHRADSKAGPGEGDYDRSVVDPWHPRLQ